MFCKPMLVNHGTIAKGMGIATALRTKVIPTKASAVNYHMLAGFYIVEDNWSSVWQNVLAGRNR